MTKFREHVTNEDLFKKNVDSISWWRRRRTIFGDEVTNEHFTKKIIYLIRYQDIEKNSSLSVSRYRMVCNYFTVIFFKLHLNQQKYIMSSKLKLYTSCWHLGLLWWDVEVPKPTPFCWWFFMVYMGWYAKKYIKIVTRWSTINVMTNMNEKIKFLEVLLDLCGEIYDPKENVRSLELWESFGK